MSSFSGGARPRVVPLRDGRVEDDARIEPRRPSEPRELVRLGADEA